MENNTGNPSKRIKLGKTSLNIPEVTYRWTIENFVNSKPFLKDNKDILSPIFDAYNNNERVELQLKLRVSNKAWHFRCTNVGRYGGHAKVWVKYSVVNSSNEEIYVAGMGGSLISENVYLSYCLADLDELYNENVLVNGNLVTVCKIYFDNGQDYTQSEPDLMTPFIGEKSLMQDDLENLLKLKKFSNVNIIVGNKKFRAHKNILSVRSPVFSAMFEANMRESIENVVEVNDSSPEIMNELLRFIYTDRVNLEAVPIMDLLTAADKYQVEGLRVKCLESIMAKLSTENLAEVLDIVDRYEIPELYRYAVNFLITKRQEIVTKNDWDDTIASLSPRMLKELTAMLIKKF
ncbi:TD and POZ domain-containing protein 5-like [Nasonia vitripennis]|uniref:BTB domain-containing protein n=1 Tax=Nasonia vitripennis TaxID=7425 RepID=A0A7M7GL50_NASVI|nr:TD and POZ domain-containing protein 5-like [Nasonia vitripennis]